MAIVQIGKKKMKCPKCGAPEMRPGGGFVGALNLSVHERHTRVPDTKEFRPVRVMFCPACPHFELVYENDLEPPQ